MATYDVVGYMAVRDLRNKNTSYQGTRSVMMSNGLGADGPNNVAADWTPSLYSGTNTPAATEPMTISGRASVNGRGSVTLKKKIDWDGTFNNADKEGWYPPFKFFFDRP